MMKVLFVSTMLLLSQYANSQPSNDECVDATIVPLTTNSLPFVDIIPDFTDATNSNGLSPSCDYFGYRHDQNVWYATETLGTGFYSFSTVGSTYIDDIDGKTYPVTHIVTVYEGEDCGTLQEVGCSDGYLSIEIVAEKKYFVVVSGSTYLPNNVVFTVSKTPPPPPNEECVDAIIIPSTVTFPYSTEIVYLDLISEIPFGDPIFDCLRGLENPNNMVQKIWYTWTPPISGDYIFTIEGRTALGLDVEGPIIVFEGTSCESIEALQCALLPLRRATLNAGVQYFIMISTDEKGKGANLILTVKPTPPPPPNDECINATTVEPFAELTYTADTSNASPDSPNDGYCGDVQLGNLGAWYKFTNPFQVNIPIVADTCYDETNFYTQVNVFKGSSCGNLECVGGGGATSNDFCLGASFQFIAAPLTTYYILVHGFGPTNSGNYSLTVEGTKNYFNLIDSKTDTTIGLLDSNVNYLFLGSTTSSLNIEPIFAGQNSIRSVMVTFDDPPISFCDNKAPFSVFRDNNGDFRDAKIQAGAHVVTATSYDRQACKGRIGSSVSKSFNISPCNLPIYVYYGGELNDGVYNRSTIPSGCNINFEVQRFYCFRDIDEITITLRNATMIVRTQKVQVEPYFLFSNNNNNIGGNIAPGEYKLEVSYDGIYDYPVTFTVSDNGSCN